MAHKKNKSRLNKMLKAQQLQQISIGQVAASTAPSGFMPVSSSTATATVLPTTGSSPADLATSRHLSREIFRTLVSLLVVAVLLIAAVIIDRRTNYFSTFGGWLYKSLRLTNK